MVITGCSSGLGRETVKNLLACDEYHVIGAVRDVDKMEAVAEIDEFNMDNFHVMEVELNSFDSVHKFCDELKDYQMDKPIDRLICNAGGERDLSPYLTLTSHPFTYRTSHSPPIKCTNLPWAVRSGASTGTNKQCKSISSLTFSLSPNLSMA